jgi:cytosine/adenosine deaminase-related metal-dependent hydrolase
MKILLAALFFLSTAPGAIDEGKAADLVLLDKNPLDNVSALRLVNSVVTKGVYYNRGALDHMLKTASETKNQLDRQRSK